MNRNQILAGLKRLTDPPTAPYDEMDTRDALHAWLKSLKLPYEIDPFGNTLVRFRHGHPRKQVAFVAHLDHPAFRVESVKGSLVHCRAEGGLPTTGIRGAKVVLPKVGDRGIKGKVESAKVVDVKGRARIMSAVIKIPVKGPRPEPGDFAIFDMPAIRRAGNRLKMRVADDLAGCVAIVAALATLTKRGKPVDAWGIFTRAEEVGFHGAISMAIDNRLPRDTSIVSVECSQAYGDIGVGKGPVVRLGDRSGPFDPRPSALLIGAARELGKKLVYQQALMTGGTCEATAFGAFGYPVGGIALPLGAYHNQGPKGVAPEEIDIRDLEGAARLIEATALRAGAGIDDIALLRNEFILSSQEGRERLREPVDPITGYPRSARF